MFFQDKFANILLSMMLEIALWRGNNAFYNNDTSNDLNCVRKYSHFALPKLNFKYLRETF